MHQSCKCFGLGGVLGSLAGTYDDIGHGIRSSCERIGADCLMTKNCDLIKSSGAGLLNNQDWPGTRLHGKDLLTTLGYDLFLLVVLLGALLLF